MHSPEIIRALEEIRDRNGGLLRAEDVVIAASNPRSPLHSKFTWDDTIAAYQWRLQQARQLISVMTWKMDGHDEPVRVFVSLSPDRYLKGGGYRGMIEVLSDKTKREQLLADALEEMERFQAKYAELTELAEIFAAMKRAKGKFGAKTTT